LLCRLGSGAADLLTPPNQKQGGGGSGDNFFVYLGVGFPNAVFLGESLSLVSRGTSNCLITSLYQQKL